THAHRQGKLLGQPFAAFLATLPPALRSTACYALQVKPPCVLCHGALHAIGAFVPSDPQRWVFPPGYEGGCVYALCAACAVLPDTYARVEAVLLAERRAQAAAPWN